MISKEDFKAIAALDLEPIKAKLVHEESGEGWSLQRANAVEREYRRFLYLMKMFPNEETAPLVDVDTFWHYHILDTMKYAVDCQATFGYFLHHFPYVGMRGQDDEQVRLQSGERMRTLYEATFDCSYLDSVALINRADAAFCAAPQRSKLGPDIRRAFCAAAANTTFCAATSAKPAFCAATTAAPAFCAATTAKPAFCAAKTAFCAATAASTAFCAATAIKSAFCAAASANTAFCAARQTTIAAANDGASIVTFSNCANDATYRSVNSTAA